MSEKLSRAKVPLHLRTLKSRARRNECRTCDCFQGLLTQLEIDAEEDVTDLTAILKVPTHKMHGCLGCDPCPPGEVFADYLRKRNARNGSDSCAEKTVKRQKGARKP